MGIFIWCCIAWGLPGVIAMLLLFGISAKYDGDIPTNEEVVKFTTAGFIGGWITVLSIGCAFIIDTKWWKKECKLFTKWKK